MEFINVREYSVPFCVAAAQRVQRSSRHYSFQRPSAVNFDKKSSTCSRLTLSVETIHHFSIKSCPKPSWISRAWTFLATASAKSSERRNLSEIVIGQEASGVVDSGDSRVTKNIFMWKRRLGLSPADLKCNNHYVTVSSYYSIYNESLKLLCDRLVVRNANWLNVIGELQWLFENQNRDVCVISQALAFPIRMQNDFADVVQRRIYFDEIVLSDRDLNFFTVSVVVDVFRANARRSWKDIRST